jgi:hypothetical protein
MRKNSIAQIVVCALALLVLLAILVGGIWWGQNGFRGWDFGNFFFSLGGTTYSDPDSYSVGSASVDAHHVENLKINWVGGSVRVEASPDHQIHITESKEYNEDEQLRWKVSGDTLTIQYCKSGLRILDSLKKELVVSIPEALLNCFDELKIDSVSASVSVSGGVYSKINLDNVSGRVKMTDCTTKGLDMDTVSGNLDFAGVVHSVSFDSVSADCELDLTETPREVNADTVSGNVTLRLPHDASFTAKVDSISGDVSTDFNVTREKKRYVCGDGHNEFELDSVSGDLRIQMR